MFTFEIVDETAFNSKKIAVNNRKIACGILFKVGFVSLPNSFDLNRLPFKIQRFAATLIYLHFLSSYDHDSQKLLPENYSFVDNRMVFSQYCCVAFSRTS
jgi:hypothetical protein